MIIKLLEGLKSLLNSEYEKAGLTYGSLEESESGNFAEKKQVKPNVFYGVLPQNPDEVIYPFVLIGLPLEVNDDTQEETIPLTLYFGVAHEDRSDASNVVVDIFSLVERTKDILLRNKIVAEAFRQDGKVTYGFDALDGEALTVTVAELKITYVTQSAQAGL